LIINGILFFCYCVVVNYFYCTMVRMHFHTVTNYELGRSVYRGIEIIIPLDESLHRHGISDSRINIYSSIMKDYVWRDRLDLECLSVFGFRQFLPCRSESCIFAGCSDAIFARFSSSTLSRARRQARLNRP
jgi:hypothetical protein